MSHFEIRRTPAAAASGPGGNECRPRLRRIVALTLVCLLGGAQPLLAAGPRSGSDDSAASLPDSPDAATRPVFPAGFVQAAGAVGTSAPRSLHIVILEGEGALNNIRERDAREPIVQIEDENHRPVAGASVTFLIQNGGGGAGGTFSGGLNSITVVSDENGRAIARGFHPNQTKGQYTIAVSVAAGMLMAALLIHESNVVGDVAGGAGSATAVAGGAATGTVGQIPPRTRGVSKWIIIGGVVAVVTAAIVTTVVVTSSSKGATITPGNGTVTP